jgi:pimeloyl-ACP methyl ester carboxylesterase
MELIEQDIKANGIQLHVYRTGTQKPPLVFSHGITDNGLCFTPIAEQLSDIYEIILYDARGHGKSAPSLPKTTPIDRARDLGSIIDTLGLKKPGLIGHSMGAVTVALYAGLYPQVPGCIILEDPPPFWMMVRMGEETPKGPPPWLTIAAANKLKSIQELIQMSRDENPTWPEAERLPWAQSKQQVSLTIFEDAFFEDVESQNEIISRIACPTLIITADLKLGSIFPPTAADALATSLPAAKHVNIPGAGHNIRREQSAAYLVAVQDFLKGCRLLSSN